MYSPWERASDRLRWYASKSQLPSWLTSLPASSEVCWPMACFRQYSFSFHLDLELGHWSQVAAKACISLNIRRLVLTAVYTGANNDWAVWIASRDLQLFIAPGFGKSNCDLQHCSLLSVRKYQPSTLLLNKCVLCYSIKVFYSFCHRWSRPVRFFDSPVFFVEIHSHSP